MIKNNINKALKFTKCPMCALDALMPGATMRPVLEQRVKAMRKSAVLRLVDRTHPIDSCATQRFVCLDKYLALLSANKEHQEKVKKQCEALAEELKKLEAPNRLWSLTREERAAHIMRIRVLKRKLTIALKQLPTPTALPYGQKLVQKFMETQQK